MLKEIYLDNSATTPLDKEVFNEMKEYFTKEYGNAGSMHSKGLVAAHTLNLSKKKISNILKCSPEEIIFTGSGTESVNLAIQGTMFLLKKQGSKKNHIISTQIEHHAVLDTLEYLKELGFEITIVPIEKNGIVNVEKIKKEIRPETAMISVMYVNNEIGTIQPIKEIGEIAEQKNIIFHTDACQAANSEELNTQSLKVDLLSLNGSKIYGPKGIGCLYKKKNLKIQPIIYGGGQEFGLRSGTENIPAIVGLTKALENSQKNKKEYQKIRYLRDYLIKELLKIPETVLNGDKEKRVPNNVNITFLNIEGESILLKLDKYKIYASSGSACTSKSLDPSHVILALGRPYEAAHGSIRFSLSKYTKKQDLKKVIEIMPKIVNELRQMSPVKLKLKDLN